MLFGFFFLAASCSTSKPPPDFSSNLEAQEIHNDLVDEGFIDEELSSTFGTGLGGNGSGVIRFLRLLTNAESEEERMPIRQDLSKELAPLGFSAICFRTPTSGAKVRYKALHQDFVEHGPQTNRSDSHLMPLGFYHIWTERGGSATTTGKSLFRITRRSQRINLEVEMGDTSGLEDCNVE